MHDIDRAELRRALGRVARGLSILFWCLPLTFVVGVEIARAQWLPFFAGAGFAPEAALNLALFYGLLQLRHFQPQERVWIDALNRAEFLALANAGLSPFLFWWRRLPEIPLYSMGAGLLALTSLLFLMQLNRALQRLAAMIPDETLRSDTHVFTEINVWLLGCVFVGWSAWFAVHAARPLGSDWMRWMAAARREGLWLALFLTILPVAMTLSLLWKIKEAVFNGLITNED